MNMPVENAAIAAIVAHPGAPLPNLPMQVISEDVLLEKYAKDGEQTAEEIQRRVAKALASVETEGERGDWEAKFFKTLHGGFVPAGRINSAAGTDLAATLINCFVQPIEDAIAGPINGMPGIYTALTQAAETMRRGGGVGYDFSRIRPNGAWVNSTKSHASGPVSYMRVFDRSCETVESAGSRRGAQMGVMRCDHPDIDRFIHAKDKGDLTNFNLSLGVTDAFMDAVIADGEFDLIHSAQPGVALIEQGAFKRDDGLWCYRRIRARELWDDIMRSTYDHAEPGILFLDRINADNNLKYCETIAACNPCGEQMLPPYGCCCLGSINLTKYISKPFTDESSFDYDAFERDVAVSVRILDNVLDMTLWPLAEQQAEAAAKRRVGLGFLGLGDATVMLGLPYNTEAARAFATKVSMTMRDASYNASIDLSIERGAFPLFNVDEYLSNGTFASRLPETLKARIRKYGMRNSHLLSIAPTGTISLAFADNASNGIEPPFSWTYDRKKRVGDGHVMYQVQDHAWRLYKAMFGADAPLTPAFVTALEMSAQAHCQMVEAVAPYIDSAISKTINVPADYSYESFQDIYIQAWRAGLKGISTYRPNSILGSVLSVTPTETAPATAAEQDANDPDRRMTLKSLPQPALGSLRWPSRPTQSNGHPAWTFMVDVQGAKFAVVVSHTENGRPHPFEVWTVGGEQQRGLGAVAKTLSADMRADDLSWLAVKLEALRGVDDGHRTALRLGERDVVASSASSALAMIVEHRVNQLGLGERLKSGEASALRDALMSPKEPLVGVEGTLSWTVDVVNPGTGEEFTVFLKEAVVDGAHRPYALRLAGNYPRDLDGLCRLLSIDMRIIDPAWIGMKLRKLLSYGEPMGDLFARVPGSNRQQSFPSSIAYVAALVIHRYAQLGILDNFGFPIVQMGVLVRDGTPVASTASNDGAEGQAKASPMPAAAVMPGKQCPSCGSFTLVRRDGCESCTATACTYIGSCG